MWFKNRKRGLFIEREGSSKKGGRDKAEKAGSENKDKTKRFNFIKCHNETHCMNKNI